jgi:small GTP-binding protein
VTIGSAYMQQTVILDDQTEVKLHIWDTGGSERFRTMVSLYYRDTQAAIICFDIAEEQTFRSTQYWVDEMKKNNNTDEFAMVLTGNKCDISPKDRRITQQ